MQGSLFILYDTTRTAQKRCKLLNQMLSTLSIFDILGSTAYAFTTLPTPQADYLYGSEGNDKTCIGENVVLLLQIPSFFQRIYALFKCYILPLLWKLKVFSFKLEQ